MALILDLEIDQKLHIGPANIVFVKKGSRKVRCAIDAPKEFKIFKEQIKDEELSKNEKHIHR
jgi:sRNA-binding carbon storage regulator CsrA